LLFPTYPTRAIAFRSGATSTASVSGKRSGTTRCCPLKKGALQTQLSPRAIAPPWCCRWS
jgi:hypothetical protein